MLTDFRGEWPVPLWDACHWVQITHIDLQSGVLEFGNGLKYTFTNVNLLRRALTVKCIPPGVPSNDPQPLNNIGLARSGDKAISAVLLEGWAKGGEKEGMLDLEELKWYPSSS